MRVLLFASLLWSMMLTAMYYVPDTGIRSLNEICSKHNLSTVNKDNPMAAYINKKKKIIGFNLSRLNLPKCMLDAASRDFKGLEFVTKSTYSKKLNAIEITLDDYYFTLIKEYGFITQQQYVFYNSEGSIK